MRWQGRALLQQPCMVRCGPQAGAGESCSRGGKGRLPRGRLRRAASTRHHDLVDEVPVVGRSGVVRGGRLRQQHRLVAQRLRPHASAPRQRATSARRGAITPRQQTAAARHAGAATASRGRPAPARGHSKPQPACYAGFVPAGFELSAEPYCWRSSKVTERAATERAATSAALAEKGGYRRSHSGSC